MFRMNDAAPEVALIETYNDVLQDLGRLQGRHWVVAAAHAPSSRPRINKAHSFNVTSRWPRINKAHSFNVTSRWRTNSNARRIRRAAPSLLSRSAVSVRLW